MKKNEKNLVVLWTIYAAILFFSMGAIPAFCSGTCTPELSKSAAGQASQQIAATLSLSSEQAAEVAQISGAFQKEFEEWTSVQDSRRQDLLEAVELANDDGTISKNERQIIQEKINILKEGRFSMFTKAFWAASSIDGILTQEQKESLHDLKLALVIPEEVIESLAAFEAVLHAALGEMEEGAGITEETWSELKQAWNDLLDTAYLPDQLRKRLDGRLVQAVRASDLGTKMPATSLIPTLEQFDLIIGKIIEEAQQGPINPMELLADINDLTGLGGRLLLLGKMGKVYFFEVFMLSPAFSCQEF